MTAGLSGSGPLLPPTVRETRSFASARCAHSSAPEVEGGQGGVQSQEMRQENRTHHFNAIPLGQSVYHPGRWLSEHEKRDLYCHNILM